MFPSANDVQRIINSICRGGRTYVQITRDLGGEGSEGVRVFITWDQDMTVAVRTNELLVFTRDYKFFPTKLTQEPEDIRKLIAPTKDAKAQRTQIPRP